MKIEKTKSKAERIESDVPYKIFNRDKGEMCLCGWQ